MKRKGKKMEQQPVTFVDGTARVKQMLAEPDDAEDIRIREEIQAADRRFAMTLAMIRKAAEKTQVDVAHALGVTQGSIAKKEASPDMLLSTLRSYLEAVGADMTILVTLTNGETCELSLTDLATPRRHSVLSA